MRKLLILAAVGLPLGGCAQLQMIGSGISLATKSITNPVTKSDEAKIELAFDTAVQLMLTYKKACAAGTVDKNCKANIALVQPYTRQAKPLVAQLRSFVDSNDQINATVVYNQLTTLYTNLKAAAVNVGINVGS
jgi:hypothetical protein